MTEGLRERNQATGRSSQEQIEWSFKQVHSLIETVRPHPPLWDHTDQRYYSILHKKTRWKAVTSELKKEFPKFRETELSIDDVKKKFNALKATFKREVRKLQKVSANFSSSITPKWEHFQTCSFMLHLYMDEAKRASFSLASSEGSSSTVISVSEDSTGQEACDNEESTGQPVSDPLSLTPTHSPPRSLPHDDPSIRYHFLAAPSTSRPVSSVSPARKRRRKETPQVDDSSESDDTGISLCPSNKIIKATTALVSGFMALLSEKQQLEVAVKIRKLLQEHRISEENPDE